MIILLKNFITISSELKNKNFLVYKFGQCKLCKASMQLFYAIVKFALIEHANPAKMVHLPNYCQKKNFFRRPNLKNRKVLGCGFRAKTKSSSQIFKFWTISHSSIFRL